MRGRLLTVLVRFALPLALLSHPAYAQAPHAQPAQAPPDGPAVLLTHLEQLLQKSDRDDFPALLSPGDVTGEDAEQATDDLFAYQATAAVVRERDRQPLEGALPGDGYQLIVEIMTETEARARVMTVRVDVRRPRGGDAGSWRIVGIKRLTLVQGLYRLRLDTATQYIARDFTITAQDVRFVLHSGYIFQVTSAEGVTGLVLLGRGEMQFSPPSDTEKGQLRIFGGSDALTALFGAAFVRVNPADYETQVNASGLKGEPAEPRNARRAQDLFATEAPKSFNIDLHDLTREAWYILPQPGDFVAEVRTNRFGSLTYGRSSGNAEDVMLFDRAKKRVISLYSSPAARAVVGASYNEDDLRGYDVIDYNIDTAIDPDQQSVEGRTQLTLRIQQDAVATLTLRLAEPLNVTSVTSVEFGRLLFFRVHGEESLIVNLPVSAQHGTVVHLEVAYSGHLPTQGLDRESIEVEPQQQDDTGPPDGGDLSAPLEPNFLLSSRSAWYPQNTVTDYARARIRVTVPDAYGVVASGQLSAGEVSLSDVAASTPGHSYVFYANEPVRYFAIVVSRLTRVSEVTVDATDPKMPSVSSFRSDGPPGVGMRKYRRITITVDANPRQVKAGRDIASTAADIMRFYGTLMDDTPYGSIDIAMLEHDLPGGHSPAYFAIINNPPPFGRLYWGNDPAAFSGVPEFFLAHELAHQWWGQAVGWKNYHEQWISEGFAQYFAALYAQRAHGDPAFATMLRQFRRWSISESDQGPIDLGYRLGLIQNQGRIFRALVYNKGAAVLHMLRRLVGDEAFFSGLRRFYATEKFQKAGTDEFQTAMETASNRSLQRFFDRWIHGADLPTLRYSSVIRPGEVRVQFDQDAKRVFDVPVTVTLQYADGHTQDVVVPVTDAHVEQRIPTTGTVRSVEVNRDSAAIAKFEES